MMWYHLANCSNDNGEFERHNAGYASIVAIPVKNLPSSS